MSGVIAIASGYGATLAQAGDPDFDPTVRVVAIVVAGILLMLTLELVRRRRLVERYALLWMTGATALLLLAVFPTLLETLSEAVGIQAPANGLFLIALGIIYAILLHFSVAISRLGDEVKLLAQEVARLEYELRTEREARGNGAVAQPDREREPPSSRTTTSQ